MDYNIAKQNVLNSRYGMPANLSFWGIYKGCYSTHKIKRELFLQYNPKYKITKKEFEIQALFSFPHS